MELRKLLKQAPLLGLLFVILGFQPNFSYAAKGDRILIEAVNAVEGFDVHGGFAYPWAVSTKDAADGSKMWGYLSFDNGETLHTISSPDELPALNKKIQSGKYKIEYVEGENKMILTLKR